MPNPAWALMVGQEEDRFTAYLVSVLDENRTTGFLDRLLRTVFGWELTTEELKALRIDTHATGIDGEPIPGGVADILLCGLDRAAVVEVKLEATFTDNQPGNYVRGLKGRGMRDTGFAILAPGRRLEPLRQEALARLTQEGLDDCEVKTVSWESVTDWARVEARMQGLGPARTHLEDLAGLVERRIGSAARPLTEDEALALSAPAVVRGLGEAIRSVELGVVVETLRQHPDVSEMSKRKNGAGWSGYDFCFRGHKFGFWLHVHAWERHGQGPLWCQVVSADAQRRYEANAATREPLRSLWEGEDGYLPLPLRPRLEPTEQGKHLAARIVEYARLAVPEAG